MTHHRADDDASTGIHADVEPTEESTVPTVPAEFVLHDMPSLYEPQEPTDDERTTALWAACYALAAAYR